MFPAVGVALGSLHPVTVAVLSRGLKFPTWTNILNNFFLAIPGIYGSPLISLRCI